MMTRIFIFHKNTKKIQSTIYDRLTSFCGIFIIKRFFCTPVKDR